MACLILAALMAGDPDPAPELRRWQPLVGQWRGVGQVRRGSREGAWRVDGDWRWEFQDDKEALVYSAPEAKYVQRAELTATDNDLTLRLTDGDRQHTFRAATPSAGEPTSENELVLATDSPLESGLARISLRLVAKGDRLVMTLERRSESGRYSRMGEVGFTRQGSRFGQGASFVECVVTGGKGTIPVEHRGETYYVCCSGCKEYFQEQPEKVLAEYRARRAEEAEPR